ncbi:hypothetical protein GCM10028827_31970 [Mucilaginibacter myungsuensis]
MKVVTKQIGHAPRTSPFDKLRVTAGLKKTFGLSVFQTFRLLTFLLLPFTFSLITSCSFNPNLQGKGEAHLQGTWLQDSGAVQQKLLTSYRYHVRFDCDSFFIQINNKTRSNLTGDTCVKNGQWTEFIRGTYAQKQDTLFLKGQFATKDYDVKDNTACFRSGPYQEFFKVSKTSDTLIELSGTSSVIPLTLHRTKKTICTQKPL